MDTVHVDEESSEIPEEDSKEHETDEAESETGAEPSVHGDATSSKTVPRNDGDSLPREEGTTGALHGWTCREPSGSERAKRLRRWGPYPCLMKYRIVLEYDPATRHYTATVPGLPGLILDAKSEKEAVKLAREGIALYLEELSAVPRQGSRGPSEPLRAKILTVDV